MGCFECYDIYCERCESKDSCHQLLFEADSLVPDLTIHDFLKGWAMSCSQDRRIIELEMRKHRAGQGFSWEEVKLWTASTCAIEMLRTEMV